MTRILVVDDSNFARRTLRQTLERAGHTVIEASSGLGALESFFLEQPELVLLDLTMEDMGGVEVLEQLREAGATVPVIVISADIQPTTEKIVRDAGATEFVGKPVISENLLRAINDAVGAER